MAVGICRPLGNPVDVEKNPSTRRSILQRISPAPYESRMVSWLLGGGLSLLWISLAVGCSVFLGDQCYDASHTVTILTYNVQNLFDGIIDGTEYPEYVPDGGSWDDVLYRMRLGRTARVIRDSVNGGPDIVALQEVENERILDALANSTLSDLGYTHTVLYRSPGSAVNVGILSRLPVTNSASYRVTSEADAEPTREILEASINCNGTPLVLLVCHWKSRKGGAKATETRRIQAARVVALQAAAVLEKNPQAELIVLGDLNESIDEWSRIGGSYRTALVPWETDFDLRPDGLVVSTDRSAVSSWRNDFSTETLDLSIGSDHVIPLFSPWGEAKACGHYSGTNGSYWYDSCWETFDNFLLSAGLLDQSGLSYSTFSVMRSSYLTDSNGHPLAWNIESNDGYSDHLPLLLRLSTQ